MPDDNINISPLKEKKLTQKEKLFCENYILDWNATKAARLAGYSEKTAKEIGYENLTKPHIKAYISEIQKDLEKLAGISKLKVINEHAKIGFSSFTKLHDTWIELKDFEELKKTNPEILDCIQEIETKKQRKIQWEYDEDKGKKTPIPYEVEYIKIKFYNKQSSLEAISKMLGYNEPDKVDVSNSDGSLQLSKYTPDQLHQMALDAIKIEEQSKK